MATIDPKETPRVQPTSALDATEIMQRPSVRTNMLLIEDHSQHISLSQPMASYGTYEPRATGISLHAMQNSEDQAALSLQQILREGKAIIDGGATSSVASVASVDAMEQIMRLNQAQDGSRDITGGKDRSATLPLRQQWTNSMPEHGQSPSSHWERCESTSMRSRDNLY